jgi:hypothetical protein
LDGVCGAGCDEDAAVGLTIEAEEATGGRGVGRLPRGVAGFIAAAEPRGVPVDDDLAWLLDWAGDGWRGGVEEGFSPASPRWEGRLSLLVCAPGRVDRLGSSGRLDRTGLLSRDDVGVEAADDDLP